MRTKLIIYAGLGLIVFSGIYDVIIINIPPQDPPPELIAERIRQYRIRDIMAYSGVSLLAIGTIAFLTKKS